DDAAVFTHWALTLCLIQHPATHCPVQLPHIPAHKSLARFHHRLVLCHHSAAVPPTQHNFAHTRSLIQCVCHRPHSTYPHSYICARSSSFSSTALLDYNNSRTAPISTSPSSSPSFSTSIQIIPP
ncbi:hypothetical protein BCR44DRAFT_1436487, partial [Catenaria anguillulae PL171]